MADLLLNISYDDPPAQKSVPKTFVIVLISCRSLNNHVARLSTLESEKE
jgi:hypothetical protein